MTSKKTCDPDETMLIALEEIGHTLQVMESLYQRLEQHVHSRVGEAQESGHPQLDHDIPSERTVH